MEELKETIDDLQAALDNFKTYSKNIFMIRDLEKVIKKQTEILKKHYL